MMNSGKWSKTIDKKEAIECVSSPKCRTTIWNTETPCELKYFTDLSTRRCLKNQRVYVIGDSRARQIEIALYSRLTKNLTFFDNKSHELQPLKESLENNQEIDIVYPWMKKSKGVVYDNLVEEFKTKRAESTWYVLGHVHLHPIRGYKSSEVYLTGFLEHFRNFTFPLLKNHAVRHKNSKIIWIGEENTFIGIDADKFRRDAFIVINAEVEKMINGLGLPNFVAMNANTRTMFSGENLLAAEGIHKEVRRKMSLLSLPSYIDTTYMLNFFCQKNDNKYCCA